jgi:hypothetical protein
MSEPVRQHYELASTGKLGQQGSAPSKSENVDKPKSQEQSSSEKPGKNA